MPLFRKSCAIIFGSILLSVGINFFLVPYHLLDGGIIGIGLIVKYVFGVQTGLTMILISVPIFLAAWFYYRNYFYNSLHGMLFSSFIIDLLYPYHGLIHAHTDLSALSSSVIGGILVGIGIGLMLRHQTSTGGTDLLALFMAKALKLNVGFVIFLIDAIVICAGGLLISQETFFLSGLTILCVGVTTSVMTLRT